MMLNIDGVEFPDFPAPLTTEERKEALEFLKGYIKSIEVDLESKKKLSVRAALYFSREMKSKIVADCESFYIVNRTTMRELVYKPESLSEFRSLGFLMNEWRYGGGIIDFGCKNWFDEYVDRLKASCGEDTDFPPLNIYQNVDGLLYFL